MNNAYSDLVDFMEEVLCGFSSSECLTVDGRFEWPCIQDQLFAEWLGLTSEDIADDTIDNISCPADADCDDSFAQCPATNKYCGEIRYCTRTIDHPGTHHDHDHARRCRAIWNDEEWIL